MDSSNIKPLAGFSVLRRFGATLSLFVTLALAACQPGPAQEGDDFLPDPVDGIGTSPSDPDPTPDPDPPPPTSGKRVAGPNDPSGCPSGMVVITGTTGNDVLEGSSADECFVGLEGDDSIFTGGGYDLVIAGPGLDYVAADVNATVIGGEDVVRLR